MPYSDDFERLRATQLYRPGRPRPAASFSTGRWAAPIDRLLSAGYSFLGCRYTDQGVLFRGQETGLSADLATGAFGHFSGGHAMCDVERAMNVFFLSHEISDALTVAALQAGKSDGGILVIRSALFNRELDAYRAAVLAIGDSGLIFRYPLLTRPLTVADIDYLLIPASMHTALGPIPAALQTKIIDLGTGTRERLEQTIVQTLARRGITPAAPLAGGPCPST